MCRSNDIGRRKQTVACDRLCKRKPRTVIDVTASMKPVTLGMNAVPRDVAASLLDDAEIADAIRAAFGPHRCVVKFDDRLSRLSLFVYCFDGRELIVEATRTDSLRDRVALSAYINEVQSHLTRRQRSRRRHAVPKRTK